MSYGNISRIHFEMVIPAILTKIKKGTLGARLPVTFKSNVLRFFDGGQADSLSKMIIDKNDYREFAIFTKWK